MAATYLIRYNLFGQAQKRLTRLSREDVVFGLSEVCPTFPVNELVCFKLRINSKHFKDASLILLENEFHQVMKYHPELRKRLKDKCKPKKKK